MDTTILFFLGLVAGGFGVLLGYISVILEQRWMIIISGIVSIFGFVLISILSGPSIYGPLLRVFIAVPIGSFDGGLIMGILIAIRFRHVDKKQEIIEETKEA